MKDILEYQFSSGIEAEAIYGTRAKHGLLSIKTRKETMR